ncbi:uncharacterized protein [Watersipora subatra]|uniref:uncharacterized protein n=1 Tax=Watersipora subatra TaxID=2589382 RepID=UPI00355BECDD
MRNNCVGAAGNSGVPGIVGTAGEPGLKGESGDSAGGAVYTRWGRTTCGSDAVLVYQGFTGGSRRFLKGGGANYQCMAYDAEYNSRNTFFANISSIVGTEYETYNFGIFSSSARNQNAPCAVCQAKTRSSVIMIPGKRNCPTNEWTLEYEGYLMSGFSEDNGKTTFECVDAQPEYRHGEGADNDGSGMFFNRVICQQGVPCPPYKSNNAITCVVCTN